MEKKEYKATINAPREKVWKILWGDSTYREWTSPFSEGSRAETDWKKGSKVLFLNGENDGMVAKIDENIPNEYMSFQHIGTVKKGVEDVESDEVKAWAGSHENYKLNKVGDKTELVVEMDVSKEWQDYFNETWPKALKKLKEIAEKN